MQHPDEGMIHTWLDGELSVEDAADIEAHASECPECAAAIAEARGLVAASSRIVSALDVVPGGVIPIPKTVSRPWYASTQFRAAAALLLVAGTSMLLTRGKTSPSAALNDKALSVAADARETSEAATQLPPAVPAPVATQPPARALAQPAQASVQTLKTTLKPAASPKFVAPQAQAAKKSQLSPMSSSEPKGRIADTRPDEAADRVAEKRDLTRGPFDRSVLLDHVVVTGVAVANESDLDLRIISLDSAGGTRRTVFETNQGVQVTLTEDAAPRYAAKAIRPTGKTTADPMRQSAAAAPAPKVNVPTSTSTMPSAVPIQPPAADMAKAAREMHTIKWVDAASGRSYSLTGPLTVEQLEALKPRAKKLKR